MTRSSALKFVKRHIYLTLQVLFTRNCLLHLMRDIPYITVLRVCLKISNQIGFIGPISSKEYHKRPSGVACGKGYVSASFLIGSMCTEGIGCRRRVLWVLQGTGTASWRPGVSWRISPTMRWPPQPANHSRLGQSGRWKRIGDGGFSISVGGTYMRGSVALCGLDEWRWTPWGIPEDHGWSWTWILDHHGFAGVEERIFVAVGELLHAGHV